MKVVDPWRSLNTVELDFWDIWKLLTGHELKLPGGHTIRAVTFYGAFTDDAFSRFMKSLALISDQRPGDSGSPSVWRCSSSATRG